MACTIEDVTDQFDPRDFDKALGDLLVGHEGSTGAFLISVFDFLKRKTNFFKEPEPRRRVLDALRAVSGESEGMRAGFLAPAAKPAAQKAQQQQHQDQRAVPAPAPAAAAAASATAIAQPAPEPAAAATAGAVQPQQQEQQQEQQQQQDAEAASDKSDQAASKGIKPNAGRGADLGRYSWTQTLHEVSVSVPVGAGVKARQLDVATQKQHLRVGVKGQEPLVDGPLAEAIKPDETMWNLADGVVELTLTKAEGMHWWGRVLAADPPIDVQAVEPESSKLGDLDPETRQTVEKMMFDQRQKALGLPTSDEMQKQEMLKRFMAAHPEMDFSNAKIM